MSEDLPTIESALNEFFSLKLQFESKNEVFKRKILNNKLLSKREKRAEFLKLMPKCINCNRPSKKGTIFSITYKPADDKTDEYRVFKAICGNLADPCNLNIEIHVGKFEMLDKVIDDISNEIKQLKRKIIDDKNRLLFGLLTTETAIKQFDEDKTAITEWTSIYENYLDKWNNEFNNPTRKLELEETLIQTYEYIDKIKDCIKKMNETGDSKFAYDAASIYQTTLYPLLLKVRQLRFRENYVFKDDNNSCKLIQNESSISDSLISGFNHAIVSYDVGLKVKKPQEKMAANIGNSDIDDTSSGEVFAFKPKQKGGDPIRIKIIPEDEPVIGKGIDGISWNNPEYQNLWNKLPDKLKTEFKLNIDWMKGFMHKCVNDRRENGCELTTPPDLVMPPRQMTNGQYDFGISIYNKVFNDQPKSLQDAYLTFYKEDLVSKVRDYKMFEDALNKLVEKEVGFSSGFF